MKIREHVAWFSMLLQPKLRILPIGAAVCLLVTASTGQANEVCFQNLLTFLRSEVETDKFPGVAMVVDRAGKIILDTQYGHLTPAKEKSLPADAIFHFFSMTKPITSVAALMLHERGKLNIDDRLSKYIPEFRRMEVHTEEGLVAAEREITIRDLLRHTSGITYGFFGEGAVRAAYRAAGIGAPTVTNAQMAKDIADLPLEHQPGTTWEYSRSTDVLGRVIEIASGQPIDVFFKESILGPLGMPDTDFYIPAEKQNRAAGSFSVLPLLSKDGAYKPAYLSGGSGLVSTMSDYLKFLRMLRNGGELDGVRLLTKATVEEMSKDQLFGNGIKPGKYYINGHGHGFGLGLSVKLAEHEQAWPGPVGSNFWVGAAGTLFWLDPVNELIAIYLVQTLNLNENFIRWATVRSLFYQDYGMDGSNAATCLG